MQFSTLFTTFLAAASFSLTQADTPQVPVPWYITDLQMYNTRHGSGGTWQFNILDTPTKTPQGFNTTCHYYNGGAYYFAIDGAPIDQACNDPSVRFSLYSNPSKFGFTLNVTHLWGNCGSANKPRKCNDNGTWTFSKDDVSGQEFDVRNNFGQAGSFSRSGFSMYPNRAVASSKCEFC